MARFVIVHCAKQAFPAVAYLMAMLIVVIGITQQRGAAVSDLVAVFIIMIGAIRQNARTTEDLFHDVSFPFRIIKRRGRNGSCPICESLSPFLLLRVRIHNRGKNR